MDTAELPPVDRGSITAQIIAALWRGQPATTVESPPGAGKTQLVVTAAAHLSADAKLSVVIACQRVEQAVEVANRLHKAPGVPLVFLHRSKGRKPPTLHSKVSATGDASRMPSGPVVVVGTAARLRYVNHRFDVLVVDEAWQQTTADFTCLAPLADQYLLVGDPGQIPPVVRADTSRWATSGFRPQAPAPDMLHVLHPDPGRVLRLRLPDTYRVGHHTAELLQAFYGFTFGSARPPRHLHLDGHPAPEYVLEVVHSRGPVNDPAVADHIAARVRHLLTGSLETPTGRQALAPEDVAVLAPHVVQVTAVRARLADLPAVLVDTPERAQGLEREATVAWDPIAGKRHLTEFDRDLGRLCVMLSRHRSHLTVVTRDDVADVLGAADPTAEVRVHREVRARLRRGCNPPQPVTPRTAEELAHA